MQEAPAPDPFNYQEQIVVNFDYIVFSVLSMIFGLGGKLRDVLAPNWVGGQGHPPLENFEFYIAWDAI